MKEERTLLKRALALNMKRYRSRLRLTQDQAAERADLTTKYWQRLEMVSQIDLPSLPALLKIAGSLEIPPWKLLKF